MPWNSESRRRQESRLSVCWSAQQRRTGPAMIQIKSPSLRQQDGHEHLQTTALAGPIHILEAMART